ncbi:hypothetical protein B9479_004960 [Cryptococcus floricola]|uniref:DUF1308 domain-containing protein n=1 Tax=Cryptococcus floricola TaxID=2591691 RepID=A0A5D3AU65_9TREE|nr:hypothetical protein B9479_004960 [Cryptococcus floricola]
MEQVLATKAHVDALLESATAFLVNTAPAATYHAPIIDWHHPHAYRQPDITGLKKFITSVQKEQSHLDGLVASGRPPKDLATNAIHLLAVWEEVQRAEWPIGCIAQVLECPDGSQVKVDVVAKGGQEWIKVNTMKESRLMAELREHDSYCNSDYSDSDSEGESRPLNRLTNSAIEQAASIVKSAKSYPRLPHSSPPKVRYVLNRLEEDPEGGYRDPRIKQTFETIRNLGADLVLASSPRSPCPTQVHPPPPKPTSKILLDLSVVVALCCDSTHRPLPTSDDELESRFRPLVLGKDGQLALAAHVPVTKDLRDQLRWESKHPLIQELKERLAVYEGTHEFWVTEQVRTRLPNIADIIGGQDERRRARAIFTGDEDFWQGSRWKGNEGILRSLRLHVLPEEEYAELDPQMFQMSPFRGGFATVCQMMLAIVEKQASASSLPPPPPAPKTNKTTSSRPGRRSQPGITIASRLPSNHTLQSFLAGLKHGMTVLTNNRGAVGKVVREMGVNEGMAYGQGDQNGEAVAWVVNPSSLSEWRRKQVEAENEKIRGTGQGAQSDLPSTVPS